MKRFRHFFFVILVSLCGVAGLSSCWSLVNDLLEYDASTDLQHAQKRNGAHMSAKAEAKEAEKWKQQGKCPTCRGVGKTPDGRYACTVCNGTGKYTN